uniref:Integrase catalytic domain-containing protein n=1 Tax=Tanacetum cinerariifolium TaxID=118510 RepID=A0A6L2K347_TANCI|nr:hypothetical protein [Tanacetum cinerariifolium]
MELWVELKRMYEPDPEDQLWTLTQNFMHAPVEWKLYDLSGVHHVTAKDKEIFMLVEKDYPLIKGLALVMISYKLQVCVDDIIFGSTNKDLCKAFEKLMKDKFQKGSTGKLTFFLGLQVKQKQDGIYISHDKYIAKILRRFGLTDRKSASTPIDTEKPLLEDPDGEDVDVHTYRSMIGSLMYLNSSRTDIMFAVYTCAHFQVTPKASHLHAVKRIFRLGHVNFKTINKLVKGNLIRRLPSKVFTNENSCVACKKGKQHRASCKSKTDETASVLKTFIVGLENLLSLKVKIIRCDNGTEFKNTDLNQFCGLKGIKREFNVPRTPQQNGIVERKNKTLIEAVRTLLADSLLPIPFWVQAINTACYVQNRVLVTKPHNKTPYELLHGRFPCIGFMRPFGCPVTLFPC